MATTNKSRTEDSGRRRPSADFLARFKEQHFSPTKEQNHDHLNEDPGQNEHLDVTNMHTMYQYFTVVQI